jgi:hypothetical protein
VPVYDGYKILEDYSKMCGNNLIDNEYGFTVAQLRGGANVYRSVLSSAFGISRNIDSEWCHPSQSGSICARHMFYMPHPVPCISFASWKIRF